MGCIREDLLNEWRGRGYGYRNSVADDYHSRAVVSRGLGGRVDSVAWSVGAVEVRLLPDSADVSQLTTVEKVSNDFDRLTDGEK